MANDNKFRVKNGLETQNVSFIDSSDNEITVSIVDDRISFSGDSGQLFSVTDSMTGTIFAVNDISGVPSIEVDDDGTIRLAELSGNVLIGTTTDDGTNRLQVAGGLSVTDLVVSNTISGAATFGNITTTGYLRGPATFTIDPAAHGDDTGTVVIAGNLQVDGTTTTINSTTVTIDDKNLVLASGAANAAAADGAGITIDGASATLLYSSVGDQWQLNKALTISGNTAFHDGYHPNADKWTTARTLSLTGAVTGSASIDGSGNVSLATTNTADPTLTLAGDASGSATFTNLGNATLTVTIADDSHNHVISNVDGLQTALDAKFDKSGGTITGNVTLSGADGENALTLSGVSPTMAFTDTTSGEDNFFIHVNSNNFYILTDRDGAGGYNTWETPHPLVLEADTNIGYLFGSRIFADNYHPNADKWTTARTNTVTLTGDVTGTASASVDGSANWQVSIATSLAGTYDNYVSWTAEDGDGTTYTVTSGDTLKFAEGTAIDVNFTADDVLTISHADTSSQASVNNSNGTVIQDVTLDTNGHVTGLASVNLDTRYQLLAAPNAPSITSATIVGETVEIVFAQSSSSDVDGYEIWSDGGGVSYALIGRIPEQDVSASMSFIDATFTDTGTINYRVYAIRGGVYSAAATTSVSFTVPSLDVTNFSAVPDLNVFQLQYEIPESRFLDHIEIYLDTNAASGSLLRANASLLYSGANSNYTHNISALDRDNYHQFWVECVTV